jgi:hypothetical protein
VNPDAPSEHRESARTFLNGSGMLLHWCHVAALDPTVIARLGEKLGRMETFMTANDALPPIPGAREPGMLTTFVPSRPVVAIPEGPGTMDAATIAERQREGGGAANQRRVAVDR